LPEPNNYQAEREILASCLMGQAEEASRQLTPADFYTARHRELFSAIKFLTDRGDEVTYAALLEIVKNIQLSDLAEIMNERSFGNDRQNIKLLRDNTYLRQLMKVTRLIYERAEAKEYQDIETFATEVEAAISNIKPGAVADLNTLLLSSAKRLEDFFDDSVTRESGPLGYRLSSELYAIEKRLDGIQQGLYLLGGTPNTGKTTILCNLARSLIEANEHLHIAFFSQDDHARKIYFRLLAGMSQRPINYVANLGPLVLHNDNLHEPQRGIYFNHVVNVKKLMHKVVLPKLHIFDSSNGTDIGFIDETSRAINRKYGRVAVIVDGLSKVQIRGFKGDATAKTGELSAKLKQLSNEINSPVIVTAELRKLNHPGAPCIDDLRDSSQLAYDADVVVMAHSPWSATGGDSDKHRITKAQINGKMKDFISPILDLNFVKNKISGFRGCANLVLVPDLAIVTELEYFDQLSQAESLFGQK